MKIAIADASDGLLDTTVFIQQGSFSGEQTPLPEPFSLPILGSGVIAVAGSRKKF